MPIAGGFSRTMVNFAAGARTQMGMLYAAGILSLTVIFFSPCFENIPKAALVAIILIFTPFSDIDTTAIVTACVYHPLLTSWFKLKVFYSLAKFVFDGFRLTALKEIILLFFLRVLPLQQVDYQQWLRTFYKCEAGYKAFCYSR